MPIYEYRCGSCGFEKEYLQKLSDAPITDCPSCGRAAMSKLVSAAGFQLKGSGWYVTDFKNSGAGAANKNGVEGKDGAKADKGGSASERPESSSSDKSGAAPACGAGACPACQ
jgi:putative FmdB family regulatory protein